MKKNESMQSRKVGQWLVELNALRQDQISKVLDLQERDLKAGVRSKFGELCVRSGWTDPGDVTSALSKQKQMLLESSGIGDILVSLDFLTPKKLKQTLDNQFNLFQPLEELIIDQGLCTPEQVRIAGQLLDLQKNGAARNSVASSFVPFNIMELLLCERIDEAMHSDGKCRCSQCWSNIFAVALNDLPPCYISEYTHILDYLDRFRRDYDDLLQDKLTKALEKVRSNPKAACRSRFSDEILSKRGFKGRMHEVVVHISNRHLHLSQAHVEKLFGKNHSLTILKDLMQTGQYAAQETVTLIGPKGKIPKVRVLGPPRKQSQIEISGTDQFILGIRAPVRESGKLDNTPGINIEGPSGELSLKSGTIRALRHIHMLPEDADKMGLKSSEKISVRLTGDRSTICEGVLIRATPTSALEMHIDTDEANAAGLPAESIGQILVPDATV